MFDGMHTEDGIPLVAVKPVLESGFEASVVGKPLQKHYKVDQELEFCDKICGEVISRPAVPKFQELCGSQVSMYKMLNYSVTV